MFGRKNQSFEFYSADDDAITCVAKEAVTGKTFVKIVPGGRDQMPAVETCAAGDIPSGIAFYDAAKGDTVQVRKRNVVAVTAGEALAGGDHVTTGALGKAVKRAPDATTPLVGTVHADTLINADAAIALRF